MMAIGVYYYRRTRNMSDYFLGNRKLGAWVTSLFSPKPSDRRAAGCSWVCRLSRRPQRRLDCHRHRHRHLGQLALRRRAPAQVHGACQQLPDAAGVPAEPLHDKSGLLRIVPAIFILDLRHLHLVGLAPAGRLFETVFGIPYEYAIFIGAGSTRSSAASSPSRVHGLHPGRHDVLRHPRRQSALRCSAVASSRPSRPSSTCRARCSSR